MNRGLIWLGVAGLLAGGLDHAAAQAPGDLVAPRTIAVAFQLDRQQAKLLSFTLKGRPFRATGEELPPTAFTAGHAAVQVAVLDAKGAQSVAYLPLPTLCLDHDGDVAPHIAGDTIRVHRDSFIVELPELPGADRVEVALYRNTGLCPERRVLATVKLTSELYQPAAEGFRYRDLVFADPQADPAGESTLTTSGKVWWPEDLADPDLYRLAGNASEISNRINIVIVPDGYTYAQKGTMTNHFDALVAYFRTKTPFKEHDRLLNYILVFGYSSNSGPDQCDCTITNDTAFGTAFPNDGYPCNDQGNRCLYYSGGCDTYSGANITTAELRAPAKDTTIIMVNTTRYGGCGGSRAVYSAGHSAAKEIAIHELGHSFANLADEYTSYSSCGTGAGNINTSLNATNGAWPEWIAATGPPQEGAQYYTQCIYRPKANCEMRALNQTFCPVCNQQWARQIFSHSRVKPTAPLLATSLPTNLNLAANVSGIFTVATRFATGPGVTNLLNWTITGPGYPGPTLLATNTNTCAVTLADGDYRLRCELIADANFILPPKYAANVDTATWNIAVATITATVTGNLATEDGARTGQVVFVRGGSATNALPVTLAFTGTASNGLDCAWLTNTLLFATGIRTVAVAVAALADALPEPLETLSLNLLPNGTYAIAGSPAVVTLAANLYDYWRGTEFTPAELADPAISGDQADPDGDGQTNAAEFIAGTKPKEAGSVLRVSRLNLAGSGLQIEFPTVAGKTYRVYYSNDLTAPWPWPILEDNLPGTGGTIVLTDPAALAQPRRFYRLNVR